MLYASKSHARLVVVLATLYVLITSLLVCLLAGPANAGKPCKRDCDPDPASPDRIAGKAEFDTAGGPVLLGGDGLAYVDGTDVQDFQGENYSMQVALNCKFNQLNIIPGGGDRLVILDVYDETTPGVSTELVTSVDSCDGVSPVVFRDTGMGNADCSNTDPDWGFNQVFRSRPGAANVCDLAEGQSVDVALRFQTNLHHRTGCRGGKGKCGKTFEGIEVNYGDDAVCENSNPVRIACTGPAGAGPGQCAAWRITSTGLGLGCLSHESGGAAELIALPFGLTFTPQ